MGKERKRTAGVEILAPAGSIEGLRAAIGAGADAVYMGGARFGARAYADNPEQDALCAAIDYVHLHGRRIYLTVNTLLKPQEMGDALYHYLKPYYEQGLDAVIVQDVGVLEFVAREFPGLPIHASTQISLVMAQGAKCFEGYPVTRLVNARELGLSEIRRIREESSLEIESFVHGALCYCYSGQCLMSSMIGGRSGNRGRCAQPCRLEYDGTYLLSPKDICTLDMIPELIEAGIDSFKIEGRMKRYEYAAGVAAAYRQEVDRYFSLGKEAYREFHKKHPEVLAQAFTDMQDLYNRGGFTKGYYRTHNGRAMMSMERPNHSGVAVARVEQVNGNRALLLCTEGLYAQDVLEIRMGEKAGGAGKKYAKESYEFTLGQAHSAGERFEAKFTPGFPVKKGDMVYRTKNSQLLGRISEEYFEKEPKIAVLGEFRAKVGEPMELFVQVGQRKEGQGRTKNVPCAGKMEEKWRTEDAPSADKMAGQGRTEDASGADRMKDVLGTDAMAAGNVYVHLVGETVQRAQKQPMGEERLRAALEKTGDTPFYFSQLEICVQGEVFIPVSALNALRREALAALAEEIAAGYRRGRESLPAQREDAKIYTVENVKNVLAAETGQKIAEVDAAESSKTILAAEAKTEIAEADAAESSKIIQSSEKNWEIHASAMTQAQFSAILKVPHVRRVYYDLAALPVEDILSAAARAKQAGKEFFLRLPRICRAGTYDFLQESKDVLLAAPVDGYLLQNYEELFLFAKEWNVQDMGKRLVADAMLYAMNAQAKQFFYKLGVAECTASYEENAQELKELGIHDMALIVYGRVPLMTSAQCIAKNTGGCRLTDAGAREDGKDFITDRKNKKLPVKNFCRFCYNVIYSPECLSLLDCGEIKELAPAALRYDFTLESPEEVLGILNGGHLPEKTEYTRGHFRRGVQ